MMGEAHFVLSALTSAAPAQAAPVVAKAADAVAGGPPTVFPPFDSSTFPSQILWLVITFGALYFMLSRVAVPRLSAIVDGRRERIEGDLEEADKLRRATDKAISDYEAALAEARQKAHAIAEETRTGIRNDLEAKRSVVEADLAKKVGAAETEIQHAKSEALGKVDEIAADAAASVVRTLVGAVSAEEARAAVTSVTKG